jgi:Xaa-Pro aminopeptidase
VGLDVHDAGAYHEPLQVGMVITLEPGIYIPSKNLGIRIEDEVVVTETEARYLSDGLPRTADEIEHWMTARPQAQK